MILVTAVDEEGKGFGATLGATEFISKPVDRQRLMRLLSKYRTEVAPGETPASPILVVEDREADRELICRTLRRANWKVVEAHDGRGALAAISRQLPAAIVLDLMMPRMDGFEFVAELRGNEQWRGLPVVVLTAKTLTDEDRRRLNGHVQKILAKGTDSRRLLMRDLKELIKASMPPSQPAK